MHWIDNPESNWVKLTKSERLGRKFLDFLFSDFILYLSMGTGVGLFFIFGFGVVFLVFPFFAVIYYIFYRKKTKIKTNSLERIDLAQLTKLNSILKNLGHLQNLEQLRVPLIHYANLISERYKLVFLENVVVNLNRSLLNKTFDLNRVPEEMMSALRQARAEYLFQSIKIPESYMILLSGQMLTKTNIELAILAIFQTIAMHDEDIIVSEDQALTTLLQNQMNQKQTS